MTLKARASSEGLTTGRLLSAVVPIGVGGEEPVSLLELFAAAVAAVEEVGTRL